MPIATFDLHTTHLLLEDGGEAFRVEVTPTFWAELSGAALRGETAKRVAEHDGWLVTRSEMTSDVMHWELHPRGDEIITLLSGAATLVLQQRGGEQRVSLSPGQTFVMPRGTWHRALVHAPSAMVFMTYGRGTEHRPLEG